jgi:glycosyltransferase involved in cell wall biosynthesis
MATVTPNIDTFGMEHALASERSMKPKVSIVMPVLNGERYLGEAVESILAQAYRDYELVAVDDGSTDRTRILLHQFQDRLKLRYVNHPVCKGISISVNDGIQNATGEYITFLDHDDLWCPDFLETQVGYLDKHPDVGMVHSDFQTIDSEGNIIEESVAHCRQRKRVSGQVFRQLFMDSFIAGSSVVIRKECFDRLGGFDESLHWADYHMWLRVAYYYKIDYVPKVLTKYRQHTTQSSRNYATERPDQESVPMIAIEKLLKQYPQIRSELGEKTIRRRMATLYFDLSYSWLWTGASRNARACLAHAIRRWPTKSDFYIVYALSLLPPWAAKAMRRGWHGLRRLFSEYRAPQFEVRRAPETNWHKQ